MSDRDIIPSAGKWKLGRLEPVFVRHALHHTYAAAAIVLIVTGVFLTMPDLRARLIGGYGRQILDIHLWGGWIFLAVPALALTFTPRALLRELRERLGGAATRPWPRFHLASVLISGVLLGATGVILWLEPKLPRGVDDIVANVHEVLTWFILAELGVHLLASRRKTWERARTLLGFSQPESAEPEQDLFEFSDDN